MSAESVTHASRERLHTLRERELERFAELRPRGMRSLERAAANMPNSVPTAWMSNFYEHPPVVVERGSGAGFTDIDGNSYIDFNLADTSMFTGYGLEALTDAVAAQTAAGPQFLLPTEDGAEVAGELTKRFALPFWQFTLSATQANTEAIRVARAATGRSVVLMFDGKYHGHADELLGELDGAKVAPEGLGVPSDATRHVRLVQYNDLEAVERELARGDVACILAEAAVTNTGVIRPADGFHAGLRRLASTSGTLLVIDETHTLVAGPGGLTAHWGLEPDLVVLGKAISGGIPLGAYGMTAPVASVLERRSPTPWGETVATGGTLRQCALAGGRPSHARGDTHRRRLRARRGARRTIGRRHRGGRRRAGPALALAPAVQPVRVHARVRAALERGGGSSHIRFRALQPAAPLHGKPRHLGGDRLVGPSMRHSGERGRR